VVAAAWRDVNRDVSIAQGGRKRSREALWICQAESLLQHSKPQKILEILPGHLVERELSIDNSGPTYTFLDPANAGIELGGRDHDVALLGELIKGSVPNQLLDCRHFHVFQTSGSFARAGPDKKTLPFQPPLAGSHQNVIQVTRDHGIVHRQGCSGRRCAAGTQDDGSQARQ